MSQQNINIGNEPNDGLGDTLRTAMIKINAMATELYGAALNAVAPLSADKSKFWKGIKLTLKITTANLKITSEGLLNTIQDIGQTARVTFKSLKFGDYVQSKTFSDWFSTNPAGARVRASDGSGDFRKLWIDELIAKTFTVKVQEALVGSDILAQSLGVVSEDFTVPAAQGTVTITVKDLPGLDGFAVAREDDWVRFKCVNETSGLLIADVWGQVSGYTDKPDGVQQWTFTVDYVGTAEGQQILKNSVMLVYGKSGDTYIERTVLDRTSGTDFDKVPYDRIVRWTGSDPRTGNKEVLTQRGNLNGLADYTSPITGAYFGSDSGNAITVDPDNGVRILDPNLAMLMVANGHTLKIGDFVYDNQAGTLKIGDGFTYTFKDTGKDELNLADENIDGNISTKQYANKSASETTLANYNLISDSKFKYSSAGWTAIHGTSKLDYGLFTAHFTGSAAERIERSIFLESGVYTLSMRVKTNSSILFRNFDNATLKNVAFDSSPRFQTINVSFFVFSAATVTIRGYCHATSLQIQWCKLEQGKPESTIWMPTKSEAINPDKNLFISSNFHNGLEGWTNVYGTATATNGIFQATFDSNDTHARVEKTINLDQGIYTLLLQVKCSHLMQLKKFTNANIITHNFDGSSDYQTLTTTFEVISSGDVTIRLYVRDNPEGDSLFISYKKLQSGYFPPGWTFSSQDLLNDAKNYTDTLQTYVDGTFEDGVIEQSEAKAIEKYLNTLSAGKQDIDKQYGQVYGNSNLSGTPKTNLLNAKTTYNAAYSSLVSAINTAISDGKTTPAEKATVDSKFSTYKTDLGDYSNRLMEAIDAIAQAKADSAESSAKNYAQSQAAHAKDAARNTLAAKLGYADYDDMVAKVSAKGSLTLDGLLNVDVVDTTALFALMAQIGSWLIQGGNIVSGSDLENGPFLKLIAGTHPIIQLCDDTGQQWSIASKLSDAPQADVQLNGTTDWAGGDIPDGISSASADSNDTNVDSSAVTTVTRTTNVESWQGRLITLTMPYSLSVSRSDPSFTNNASIEVQLQFFNGATEITHVGDQAGLVNFDSRSDTGTFIISHLIPDTCDTLKIKVTITCSAVITQLPATLGDVSNAQVSISLGSTPVLIQDISDGISPAGASWTDDVSGNGVKIDRDTGLVEGNKIKIAGGGGKEAHFIIEGSQLKLISGSTTLKAWNL